MQLRENVLEQIEQFLVCEYVTISHVCFFMQYLRILIDIDNQKNKYEITNHYCNWLLHKELDKSNSPVIIREIAEAFTEPKSKNDLIKKINEAISLKKLIVEIKEILWTKMPDKKIVSRMDFEDYWILFIQVILNQISFRPLKLRISDVLLDNLKLSIYGIQIVPEKDRYNIELLSKYLEEKDRRILIDIVLYRG